MNPKDCLFRIFRDVRFSKDKRPYKTNMGSFIAKGGRKSMRAGYYFHIEPDGNFAGGGIYMPPSEPLKNIRTAIFENPETFIELTETKKFKKIFTEFHGEKLKTAPKGFPREFEYINLSLNVSADEVELFMASIKSAIRFRDDNLFDYLVNYAPDKVIFRDKDSKITLGQYIHRNLTDYLKLAIHYYNLH